MVGFKEIAFGLWAVVALHINLSVAEPIRILPLGDSITHGVASRHADGGYSYRYPLWQRLVTAGTDFQFVGSLSQPYGGQLEYPGYLGQLFDSNHEGHYGWSSREIWTELPAWLEAYDADVALIHLGHNDWWKSISQGESTYADTYDNMVSIIRALQTDNQDMQIFLARVVPSNPVQPPEGSSFPLSHITMLNQMIPDIAQQTTTDRSRVTVVDQFSGFEPSTMIYDGVHPNAKGEDRIAAIWFQALAMHGSLAASGGDFDRNGVWDSNDIDSLSVAIQSQSNVAEFDLTGDGLITSLDGDRWLSIASWQRLGEPGRIRIGDADLDGVVDHRDFEQWNRSVFLPVARWSAGDFNWDGKVDGADFNLWNSHRSVPQQITMPLPEPTWDWLYALLLALVSRYLGLVRA